MSSVQPVDPKLAAAKLLDASGCTDIQTLERTDHEELSTFFEMTWHRGPEEAGVGSHDGWAAIYAQVREWLGEQS